MRFIVRFVGSQLQFHVSDGWTGDTVLSMLDEGELLFHSVDEYWTLSMSRLPASLNYERLKDLVSDVVTDGGRFMGYKERAVVIKYFSCHGPFLYGDDPRWRTRMPPGGFRNDK